MTTTRLWEFICGPALLFPGLPGQLGFWQETISVLCPWCAERFTPEPAAMDVVLGLQGSASEDPPCAALGREAWEEPQLLTTCLRCGQPLRLNPFVLDARECP